MTLTAQAQPDFSLGAFQGVSRALIPDRGFYAGSNVLLDDDGGAYKRGGSAYLSTSGLNAAGLTFILDAYLAAGSRTLIADAADFGVLDGSEASVNIGGDGLASPRRAAVIGGVAVIGGGTMYAGSRKAANYTTGTISTTLGSKAVTGAGTLWGANLDAGMFLKIGTERYYVIGSVDSDTQLTLIDAYEGSTAGGRAYTASVLAAAPRTSDYYAVGFDRLISLENDEVHFSRGVSPGGSGFPPVGNTQWQTFDATDLHKIPGGVRGIGAYFLRDTLYVFTTGGVYAVANMAYDLTDDLGNQQQTLVRVSPNLTLWANEGIASHGDAMIVPATDGVWLFGGAGGLQKLSQSIDARYIGHVRAGRKPGLATVYRNHYLLPILTSGNVLVEILVCRLDRAVRTSIGVVFPWTWLAGSGANVAGYSLRSSGPIPKLLGAGRQATARVLDCSGYFEPSAVVKQDHDATNFEYDLMTRDYTPDRLNIAALVRKLRLRYDLFDAATDDPTISAWYSIGVLNPVSGSNWGENWDSLVWSGDASVESPLSGQAPEDDGRDPFAWDVNKRARQIRFRFRSSAPAGKLVIRNLEFFSRVSGRM
jgi:hypothetical protein